MASSNFLKLNNQNYVVSPEFAKAIRRELGTLTFDTEAVEAERLGLMMASNIRSLSEGERRRLDYLTHVKNVANTIRVVGDHHDPKEWGLDGWDAVHGNVHGDPEPCGCVLQYVFDHHSVFDHFGHNRVSKERPHHYIEPHRLCANHGG